MGRDTAKGRILGMLREAPIGACVTRSELIKGSGKARETARDALVKLQKDELIEEAPVDGVRAYRILGSYREVPDVPQELEVDIEDEFALLKSLIEAKLKIEFKISEVEQSIRDKVGQSG